MTDTYTYIARSADNPDFVVTFTLDNNRLRLNLPEVVEQIGQIARSTEKASEARQQLKTQLRPGVLKAIESFSGPIQISDVSASLNDGADLNLTIWQRIGGLRLTPFWLNIGSVDNPDAAEAFVAELEERKVTASSPSSFYGPLDYWAGWAALLLLVVVLFRWPWKNNEN